ncbi:type IV pilus assembly protein PilM [Oceanospirillum sp.]|uniref:type IV pilus assembly protein PilM n=1 Tax=Oceanospirillum sp. TaxID=2021254 RepID=UPI003A9553CA
MLSLLRNKKQNTLGLDLSGSSVKLLELSCHNGQLQIESYAIASLPNRAVVERKIRNPEQVSQTLLQVIPTTCSGAYQTITAVPDAAVITRTISMDSDLSADEMESEIILEADQFIPFPIDEIAIDFEVIGPTKNQPEKQDILLVACRIETVDTLQKTLRLGGLTPSVVDVESYALERVVSQLLPRLNIKTADPVIAVVDIGAAIMNLTILHQKQTLYSRDQLFGGQKLTDEIAQRFQMSSDDAELAKKNGQLPDDFHQNTLPAFLHTTVQQISRALQLFYSSSTYKHVDYILLAGGCAATEGLSARIETSLAIPTYIANPLELATSKSTIDQKALNRDAPALLIAFGLAMRYLENAPD